MPALTEVAAQVPSGGSPVVELPYERFSRAGGRVVRDTALSAVETATSSLVDRTDDDGLDPAAAFEQSWLRSRERPGVQGAATTIRCADFFCGVGGLSIGLEEAAWSMGLEVEHVIGADVDPVLLERFGANFETKRLSSQPIEILVDGALGGRETASEAELRELAGDLDLVLAGPPCQGHSDLNNHTRRDDPRNALILRVVRFAEVCRPRSVLIENVPGAQHDKTGVVARAQAHLEDLGYGVDRGVVRADEVGVAQKRRRFFLVGSLDRTPSMATAVARCRRPQRPVTWAIEDLDVAGEKPFDTPAVHSAENRRRIAYLFENDLHDLPDSERPACHRDKAHSYRAVYGRMRPDEPAPTITVGFGSTGQGRFVHPSQPRTLTPHEAARVQSFPDWFDFGTLRRGQLQKAIGNAVPPRMASVVIRDLLPGPDAR